MTRVFAPPASDRVRRYLAAIPQFTISPVPVPFAGAATDGPMSAPGIGPSRSIPSAPHGDGMPATRPAASGRVAIRRVRTVRHGIFAGPLTSCEDLCMVECVGACRT